MDCAGDDRAADEFQTIEDCFEIALPKAATGKVQSIVLRPNLIKRSSTGKPFLLLSKQKYPIRRILTCLACPARQSHAAMKKLTILSLIRKGLVSAVGRFTHGHSSIAPVAKPQRRYTRTKTMILKKLSVPEVVLVTVPELDGVPSRQIKMLSKPGRKSMYVELTNENLWYLATVTLAQYKSCEALGGPSTDSQSDASDIEESQIDESNIDEPPGVDSTANRDCQPESVCASIEADAVVKQQPASSVLAMLCKK